MEKYLAGLDFGTDSVRCLIVNAADGTVAGEGVSEYPRWNQGRFCDHADARERQHPLDHLESMTAAVHAALRQCPAGTGARVAGMGIVTTGSTPCPVDRNGVPLSLKAEFQENPNAMFHLWKDHTAVREAEELDRLFSHAAVDYTKWQGKYSAEWFWAKVLHTSRLDSAVCEAAYTWVEHCDWLAGELSGRTKQLPRSACAAGHKALWNSRWGGLPDRVLLAQAHPALAAVYDTYAQRVEASDQAAGYLTGAWAERLGFPPKIAVAGTSFDAHGGAVGAQIRPGTLVVNLGTSAVYMLLAPKDSVFSSDLTHFCGIAEDSIVPGYCGIESGQAAFGDMYAWLKRLLTWAQGGIALPVAAEAEVLPRLMRACEGMRPADAPVVLDWINGRRYPGNNERARGCIAGIGLGTDAPSLFYGTVLGTVFGMKRIVDGIRKEGVCVERVTAIGGISLKAPQIVQIIADVLQMQVRVPRFSHSCALGGAIYAAKAAGVYPDLFAAQDALCCKEHAVYLPQGGGAEDYQAAYRRYLRLAEMQDQFE